ncbi:MAG TPA: hypothetical protein VF103_02310 [Polyangiaceae bacterium]
MTRPFLRAIGTGLAGWFVTGVLAAEPRDPERSRDVGVALVWIFGDDDVFGAPDARVPPSPAASIGDRPGYDPIGTGFRSRYTGRENRLELRLRGAADDLIPSLSTQAELALGVDVSSLGARSDGASGAPILAEDLGSFVEARLALSRRESSSLAVRLYPINGDFERVGWLEALGWGGATGPRRESPYATARGAVRAGRLSLALWPFEVFAGLKTATFLEPVADAPAVEETSYGVFGGVEARPSELVKLGVAGGYFEHGMLEGAAPSVRAVTAGGSAMFSIGSGTEETRSPVAFLGPTDDPFRAVGAALPGTYVVGVETALLVQRLVDFDRSQETTLVPARALALFGGARLGPFETSAAFTLRDVEFVMRDAPGVFPARSTPRAAQRDVERTLLLSNGWVFSELLRVDLALGLRFPAAVMTAALDRSGRPTGATLVVNEPADVELLPPGAVPVPIFDSRLTLEARLSRMLSTVGWLAFRRDYNRTRLVSVAGESAARGFAEPNRFGYGVAARAVW